MNISFQLELTWISLSVLSLASFYILWMGYVLTMDLKENFRSLRWEVKLAAILPAALSYLLDIVLNVILLSVLFLEVPKEVTITKRLARWKKMPMIAPKRARFAAYICNSWLNPFDQGHC